MTDSGHDVAVVELGGVHPRDVVTFDLLDEIERIENELVTLSSVDIAEGASVWTPVVLAVRNPGGEPFDATVVWSVPEGWQVDPAEASLAVPRGAVGELSFRLTNRGPICPVPRASFSYPLADGRALELELPVGIVRTVAAPTVAAPPMIDGVLDDASWGVARPVTELYTGEGYGPVEGETSFRFCHDGENLYVAAFCGEARMDDLTA